jgi:prophage regulatory protein
LSIIVAGDSFIFIGRHLLTDKGAKMRQRGRLIASENLKPDKGVDLENAQRKKLEEQGLFPPRVYYSERKYGYVESEIDAYVEAKIRERDEKLAAKQKTNTQDAHHDLGGGR